LGAGLLPAPQSKSPGGTGAVNRKKWPKTPTTFKVVGVFYLRLISTDWPKKAGYCSPPENDQSQKPDQASTAKAAA
jgi:hypothetical protein